jgi:AhpD family alkylhydroperoxidase
MSTAGVNVMNSHYPELHSRLQGLIASLAKEAQGPMSGYLTLHRQALADGALSRSHKELIALGIAIATHCENCIAYHVHDALHAGASRDEIVETIGVAVMMAGGPGAVYGAEALEALDQFELRAAS